MSRNWMFALVAGTAIGMSVPADVSAQTVGRGRQDTRARQEQQERAREQAQREAERERLRRERDQRAGATAGPVFGRRTTEGANRADERDRRRDDRDRYDDRYDDRYYDDWYDDRYDDRRGRNGRGPAFCRSGAGHPVHGRRWCVDKGFGLGNARGSTGTLGDIFFGAPRDRRYTQSMSRSILTDILGSVVLGRIETQGRRFASGPTHGRWLADGTSNVLQIYLGATPIARLIDSNRDGRVDNVLLRR